MMSRSAPTRILSPAFIASFICADTLSRRETASAISELRAVHRLDARRGRRLTTAPMSNATTTEATPGWAPRKPTALVVLADGLVIEGAGLGAIGEAVGEVCFNTAMTGYEEILTDPSYAGQIITFTFPHIGVVGTNEEDIETVNLAASAGARGASCAPTSPTPRTSAPPAGSTPG